MSSPISIRNNVKEKLAHDEVVSSMTVRLCRTIEVAQIAATAGFDTLYVDVEHNGYSFDTTGQICMAAQMLGVTPFVRVPTTRHEHVCAALDAGALGVIAPHIRSAADAIRLVRSAKFPPFGDRGAIGQLPHFGYRSHPTAEANQALNEATTVMVMMETVEALEHVEEIADVAGVDMMMIGTNDLTGEMGIPGQYDHERVYKAYERTIKACRNVGKHVGVGGLAGRPDLVAQFVKMGARYVSTGTDLGFLLAASTQKAKQVRELPV